MKKLTFNETLSHKLNRLNTPVSELTYVGCDLKTLMERPIVAVVGTRKPTPYGIAVTKSIVTELAREGVVIVSGLAFGIDGIAHTSTLEANGTTIAVLPSGLENIYPASHHILAEDIINKGGSLISEYESNHRPRKVEFLERNRIIAALSDLVIIPEAAGNSGSLNTAHHAHTMGIPIYAVPGNITNPMSEGTNYLLKEKARAITTAQDVFGMLGITKQGTQQQLDLTGATEEETLILQKIARGMTSAHELQKATKLDTNTFQTTLSMLEIDGKITQDSIGNWTLR